MRALGVGCRLRRNGVRRRFWRTPDDDAAALLLRRRVRELLHRHLDVARGERLRDGRRREAPVRGRHRNRSLDCSGRRRGRQRRARLQTVHAAETPLGRLADHDAYRRHARLRGRGVVVRLRVGRCVWPGWQVGVPGDALEVQRSRDECLVSVVLLEETQVGEVEGPDA